MSETYIFNSVADVAVMMALVVFCFCDVLSGVVFTKDWSKDVWYKDRALRVWLIPPWWVFPVIWPVLYVMIISSLYIFYRSVTLSGDYGQTVDVITLLFIFNMVLNKLWSPVFFRYHSPIIAWFICAGVLATGIAILYFFGANDYSDSCWIFLPYVIWTGFALLLNTCWIFKNKSVKKSEKPAVRSDDDVIMNSNLMH